MDDIVDYAYPAMMAEKALKRMLAAALNNDFELAMDEAANATKETRKLYAALNAMLEKQ
jgi:predicted aldo/keto reductase-like oxidoreductase